MTTEILELLCNTMKLERDRGVGELQRILPTLSENDRKLFENNLLILISDTESSWETKHGCLLGAKALILFLDLDDEQEAQFVQRIKTVAEKLLTDVEVRVRLAAGMFSIRSSYCKNTLWKWFRICSRHLCTCYTFIY